jgi:hypothetical protein
LYTSMMYLNNEKIAIRMRCTDKRNRRCDGMRRRNVFITETEKTGLKVYLVGFYP